MASGRRRGVRYYLTKLRTRLSDEYGIETEVESIEGLRGWHRIILIDFHGQGNHHVFDFTGSMVVSGVLTDSIEFVIESQRGRRRQGLSGGS